MNFFRDEEGARKTIGEWMDDPYMYHWALEEAQKIAFGIFKI